MQTRVLAYFCAAMAFAAALSSCQVKKLSPDELIVLERNARIADYTAFDRFVFNKSYPKTMSVFVDHKLLAKADKSSFLHICLNQQRARFYVSDVVAMDFPVSTGVYSRPTGTGSFIILQKREKYESNLFGKIYDLDNKVVNRDADFRTDIVPEGGRFVGAAMPYWQRFTWAGIGLHVGRVKAGKRLSHGCIRSPRKSASLLFDATIVNKTRVYIEDALEAKFPSHDVLLQKSVDFAYAKQQAALAKKKA